MTWNNWLRSGYRDRWTVPWRWYPQPWPVGRIAPSRWVWWWGSERTVNTGGGWFRWMFIFLAVQIGKMENIGQQQLSSGWAWNILDMIGHDWKWKTWCLILSNFSCDIMSYESFFEVVFCFRANLLGLPESHFQFAEYKWIFAEYIVSICIDYLCVAGWTMVTHIEVQQGSV